MVVQMTKSSKNYHRLAKPIYRMFRKAYRKLDEVDRKSRKWMRQNPDVTERFMETFFQEDERDKVIIKNRLETLQKGSGK